MHPAGLRGRLVDRRPRRLLAPALAALAVVVLVLAGACSPPPDSRHPWVIIGLDGAERSVIHQLWETGDLPHLRRLAEAGAETTLRTRYGISPVIWTTLATGFGPREHGIYDFVVSTPHGDVPVSSHLRRAPAIWNLAADAGLKVAVLGWWVTWPAEELPGGVVVSDRALSPGPGRVAPPSLLPRLELEIDVSRRSTPPVGDGFRDFPRDQLMTHLAELLLGEEAPRGGFDLTLVYLHGIDTVSHLEWKAYEPEAFPAVDAAHLAERAGRIPAIYRATDAAVGRIVAAAGPGANVLVLSDHGFHAAKDETVKVWLDLDRVLEALGYLHRTADGGVDLEASRAYTYATPPHEALKKLRLGRGEDRSELARQLAADLESVTFEGGDWAVTVRRPEPSELRAGAELMADVEVENASESLWVRGQVLPGAVERISRVSGAHGSRTHGILLAAGPDIAPGAALEDPRIQDITPTLLYALGLPVARDMPGRPLLELFTPEARRRLPHDEIDTYGRRTPVEAGPLRASEEDEKLLDDLRALGYLQR